MGLARAESLCAKFALYRQKCKGERQKKFLAREFSAFSQCQTWASGQ
jgi:hypothetical protein